MFFKRLSKCYVSGDGYNTNVKKIRKLASFSYYNPITVHEEFFSGHAVVIRT